MSSTYNNNIISSSSPPQSFLIVTGDNDFNRKQTVMKMIQQPNSTAPPPPPPKKRRNQPGNPNPDAEVIALSPKTIMATNRFICEVCNKGFQREQNLQLHRRGHNLPWKLKQKSNKEVTRKKVYLCPEVTCVHHDPSRALGDLTGIKKHYYRKHGEKKWKCEKCSKRYAVQSDCKAHTKTCGTKEYRCDCGTIFSRRDSYITHRAFCEALLQETTRNSTVSFTSMAAANNNGRHELYNRLDGGISPLSNHLFGNTSNSDFTPLVSSYNLNRPNLDKFEDFGPQSTNLNPNFLMQSQNNQTNLMNQHGMIQFDPSDLNQTDENHNSNNNNFFNLGFFQENNNENLNVAATSVAATSLLATATSNDDSSGLLRGLTSSTSSNAAIVNGYGGQIGHNGNFQGLMNSLVDHHQSGSSNIFDVQFGNNINMNGESDRLTLDFLGVGRGRGRGGRGGGHVSLDVGIKFLHPNHPFGKT